VEGAVDIENPQGYAVTGIFIVDFGTREQGWPVLGVEVH
jgi:hypothetical protein